MSKIVIDGVDLGNKDVKHHSKIKYSNRVEIKESLLGHPMTFKFQGSNHILGGGNYETEYNKARKENTLVTLFGMLALSSEEIVRHVVVGLPIQHYKAQKDRLKELIISNNVQDVEFKGMPRRIIIAEVAIAPESASAFYSLSDDLKRKIGDEDLVIVDVGGRTTDICLYVVGEDGQRFIKHYLTIPVGMLNIYDDFIQEINSKYTLDKTLDDGEKIFKNGLTLYGVRQDLSFTKPIIKHHVDQIFQALNINFPVSTSQVLLVGGGSLVLQQLFLNKLPHVIMANEPVYGNAIGFRKVGESLWLPRKN